MAQFTLNRLASVVYRKSHQFYDKELAEYRIGWGQQFFLLKIYENDGISLLDLALLGHFDKGTTVKAVQKLEELGYIWREVDRNDRRIHHAHTTQAAEEVVKAIYKAREKWNKILTSAMNEQEANLAEIILEKMAFSACNYINGKEEDLE